MLQRMGGVHGARTSLSFTRRGQTQGLGVIGSNQTGALARGLHLHTTPVNPDAGGAAGRVRRAGAPRPRSRRRSRRHDCAQAAQVCPRRAHHGPRGPSSPVRRATRPAPHVELLRRVSMSCGASEVRKQTVEVGRLKRAREGQQLAKSVPRASPWQTRYEPVARPPSVEVDAAGRESVPVEFEPEAGAGGRAYESAPRRAPDPPRTPMSSPPIGDRQLEEVAVRDGRGRPAGWRPVRGRSRSCGPRTRVRATRRGRRAHAAR